MGWPEAVFISVSSVAGTLLIIVAVWQVFKTWQTRMTARAALARDEDYRHLAENIVATQDKTSQELARLGTEINQLRTTVSELERILKEVG